MRIYFAIPTWNRSEQLDETLTKITAEILRSGIDARIVVSNNCSTDGTEEILEDFSNRYSMVTYVTTPKHMSGMENFQYVLALCLDQMSERDYVWSFGDDDDLNSDCLLNVHNILKNELPYFASAGNSKLSPHSGNYFVGGSTDLALNFGFFLTFGFISQCIFSRFILNDIIFHRLMSDRFKNDSYSHGTSILMLGQSEKCIYIDSPISTWREYQHQSESTQERWTKENVFEGIFQFIHSIEYLISQNIIPKRLPSKFFRFWRWHFWDQLIYDASSITIQNPSAIDHHMWDKIYRLCDFLNDLELSKRLRLNIDLFRIMLASRIDPSALKYMMDCLHISVYGFCLGDPPKVYYYDENARAGLKVVPLK